ncbi:MAG TPA: BON domain-containing protein [Polyangiaceae bacterium]|nr:BON domain-containing protein [Polyangiaceae bacterium]
MKKLPPRLSDPSINQVVLTKHHLHRNKLLGTSDSEIGGALLAAVTNDPRVRGAALSVNVPQGVATVSGAVPSLSAKLAVGELARNTVGALLVKNELEVQPAKIADDEVLSQRARAALLWDPEIGAQGIEVTAHDGLVTITGIATTAYDRQRATDIVSAIAGIRALDNQLRVSHGESRDVYKPYADPYAPCCAGGQAAPLQTAHTDAEIAATIRQQLRWSPILDDSTISVSVTGGRAVLTGDVATDAERGLATQAALRGGALEVDNRLSVVASRAAL